MRRLPDSEFEIMDIIWKLDKAVVSADIQEHIANKGNKINTIISYLKRLENKNFISSEKIGKERYYKAIVSKDEYLKFETALFFKQYHNNSILSFVNSLIKSNSIEESELQKLKEEIRRYSDE